VSLKTYNEENIDKANSYHCPFKNKLDCDLWIKISGFVHVISQYVLSYRPL